MKVWKKKTKEEEEHNWEIEGTTITKKEVKKWMKSQKRNVISRRMKQENNIKSNWIKSEQTMKKEGKARLEIRVRKKWNHEKGMKKKRKKKDNEERVKN